MQQPPQKTVFCFIIQNNKILLLERQNTWFENKKFCPPGGNVDNNEEPIDAAVRECKEETNLDINSDSLTLIRNFKTQGNGRAFVNYYYLTREHVGTAENLEPHRHTNIKWFDINDLPTNTSSIVLETLKLIYP